MSENLIHIMELILFLQFFCNRVSS